MKGQKSKTSNHWERAKRYGIDMSIIDANLQKTPTERAITHQAALELALTLREAGRKYYARLSKTSKTARR